MNYYWTSFYASADLLTKFEYHGPWWVSGERWTDGAIAVCAAVVADTADAAKAVILSSFDSDCAADEMEWRFANLEPDEPFCDRFPRAHWMKWPWPAVAAGAAGQTSTEPTEKQP